MRDDQKAPAVLLLQSHQFHHEDTSDIALLAAVAKVCEIIDDDYPAISGDGGLFDVHDNIVLVVLCVDGFCTNFCA